jgi:alpha-tubulin suppressor-like RCC1 family protein
LTKNNDLYIWGQEVPSGSNGTPAVPYISALGKEIDPIPVDLNGYDILDVACGKNCFLALTEDHRLFVIGSNRNGQLGLGDVKSVDQWTEVILPIKENAMMISVHTGYKNSFVVVRNKQEKDKGKTKRIAYPDILN